MNPFMLAKTDESETDAELKKHQGLMDLQYRQERFGPDGLVHENLRAFRISKNFRKQQMADFMGVTVRSYYTYENGTRSIPSDALVKLATMTGVDLHKILMGRPASSEAQIMKSGLEDMQIIGKLLRSRHPELGADDHHKVARRILTQEWGNLPRMHPTVMRMAISQATRYRDEPLRVPAPPIYEDFDDDSERYEEAMNDWLQLIDDNLASEKS